MAEKSVMGHSNITCLFWGNFSKMFSVIKWLFLILFKLRIVKWIWLFFVLKPNFAHSKKTYLRPKALNLECKTNKKLIHVTLFLIPLPQESISATFELEIFVRKCLAQLFSSYILSFWLFGAKISAHTVHIKCWWNWHK